MKPTTNHWFKVTVDNCKLSPNDSRPRTQTHHISAATEAEARLLAPQVLKYLWTHDTMIAKCEQWS